MKEKISLESVKVVSFLRRRRRGEISGEDGAEVEFITCEFVFIASTDRNQLDLQSPFIGEVREWDLLLAEFDLGLLSTERDSNSLWVLEIMDIGRGWDIK